MIPYLQIDDATAQFITYELGGVFAFLSGIAGILLKQTADIARIKQILRDKLNVKI